MNLAVQQLAFAAQLCTGDEAPVADAPGMEIYRNAYRARLLSALETSFEQTRAWVGADSFTAAACHHVIASPPANWTLDTYGADFPATLAVLFAQDGEVADLAWLEWQLQQAFAAPDQTELDGQRLARANLGPGDWEQLRLTMAAGFAARPVNHDCAGLWQALRTGDAAGFKLEPVAPGVLIVWRQGLVPHYRVVARDEFAALGGLMAGATFGATAALAGDTGAAQLGAWFAQWLGEGLFADYALG